MIELRATDEHEVVLGQVRRRLRRLLDAGRRRHVADQRFYRLLGETERARRLTPAEETQTADGRLTRVAPLL